MSRIAVMEQRLRDALQPTALKIEDESAAHVGHAGAAAGGGHYALAIASAKFAGLPTLARHRLVYQALGELMQREIHALRIEARAPDEQ